MAITELYSKRQKKIRGEEIDVYSYDHMPQTLRTQIIFIIEQALESLVQGKNQSAMAINLIPDERTVIYSRVTNILRREYGTFNLSNYLNDRFDEDVTPLLPEHYDFFVRTDNIEDCLDVIELFFKEINGMRRDILAVYPNNSDDAISELNQRFNEHGVGYQFVENQIIRVDSQYIHSEVVKPILQILGRNSNYSGSNDEFLSAHEHYRHQRYKACLNDCLKSFESLMKGIHKKHSWPLTGNETAQKLINSCLSNNLVPKYLQYQFTSIRTLLESGIPTIRNKDSGHGQGAEITEVPEYLASYTLHLTATNLLFLAKCEENYTKK
ncbi:hypothetical protein GQP39_000111 [Salmonella enterica subsp. enterica]|nr:hypothetical protein [Salmonella enterica subsp. enterica serovar Amager]